MSGEKVLIIAAISVCAFLMGTAIHAVFSTATFTPEDSGGVPMVRVASNTLGEIFTVAIDGEEYIVVLGSYKAAICPKTK